MRGPFSRSFRHQCRMSGVLLLPNLLNGPGTFAAAQHSLKAGSSVAKTPADPRALVWLSAARALHAGPTMGQWGYETAGILQLPGATLGRKWGEASEAKINK